MNELRLIFKYVLSVASVMMLLLLTGCTGQNETNPTSPEGIVNLEKEGKQMPAFSLLTPFSEDTVISSDSLNNKVILVNFFASWCRSCIEEISLLKTLQDRFGKKDFAIVALAVDTEDMEGLKNLIRKQKLNYPILLADEEVKKEFGGIAILPTMFLVGRDGKLLKKYLQANCSGETRAKIARLIEWLTIGSGVPGCMHGGGSPDGAKLVINANTDITHHINLAKRLANLTEEIQLETKKK